MNQIDEGAKKLAAGSTLLKNKLGESINNASGNALTTEQVNTIKEMTIQSTIDELDEAHLTQIGNTTWTTVKNQLDHSEDTTVSGYVTDAVTTILATYLGGQTNLTYYGGCMQDNQAACSALAAAGFDKDTVTAFKNQLATSIGTAAHDAVYYTAENTSKSVAQSIAFRTACQTAGDVAASLAPQVANQVKNASIDSLGALYNGIDELDQGINTLSSGISKFNTEGISKITDLANNKLKGLSNKIKTLVYLGNEYNSFASGDLLDNGETKFILIINSKNVKEETKTTKKEEKKDNLGDRIVNLFN